MTALHKVETDIAIIEKYNESLESKLKSVLLNRETRGISYRSDAHHNGAIYSESSYGENVRAWSPHTHENMLVNIFMFGTPNARDKLTISIQLNFPKIYYDRSSGGAFVVDKEGKVFLAHRGHLSNHGKIPKRDVLREFSTRSVSVDDDGQMNELILICALDDSELLNKIFAFAEDAREIAIKLRKLRQNLATTGATTATPDNNEAQAA